jgi:hypothetical protein
MMMKTLCRWFYLRGTDPQRDYKEGYIAARQYVRQHPSKAVFVAGDDAFDRGWDAGTYAEILHQCCRLAASPKHQKDTTR